MFSKLNFVKAWASKISGFTLLLTWSLVYELQVIKYHLYYNGDYHGISEFPNNPNV